MPLVRSSRLTWTSNPTRSVYPLCLPGSSLSQNLWPLLIFTKCGNGWLQAPADILGRQWWSTKTVVNNHLWEIRVLFTLLAGLYKLHRLNLPLSNELQSQTNFWHLKKASGLQQHNEDYIHERWLSTRKSIGTCRTAISWFSIDSPLFINLVWWRIKREFCKGRRLFGCTTQIG